MLLLMELMRGHVGLLCEISPALAAALCLSAAGASWAGESTATASIPTTSSECMGIIFDCTGVRSKDYEQWIHVTVRGDIQSILAVGMIDQSDENDE